METLFQTLVALVVLSPVIGAIVYVLRSKAPARIAVIRPEAPVAASPAVPARRRDRSIAIALAFFLGGLGVHKFYLGRPGWGILYALFVWSFIPMLVAAVEALMLLCLSDAEFHRIYG